MAATDTEISASPPVKSSKLVVILSTALFLAGLGLGFFAISSGWLPFDSTHSEGETGEPVADALPDVAFVTIPTVIITLPPEAKSTHLRVSAQIEVPTEYQADVEFLMPRIQDLMNGYLRALTADDIERPGALFEIRLQLFRRVVMVVGLGRANGLLVTEFILN